jgi:hypothetical protein
MPILILKALFFLRGAARAVLSFVRAKPHLAIIIALVGICGLLWWRLDQVRGQLDQVRSEKAAMIAAGKAQDARYRRSEQSMSAIAKAIKQEKDREIADIAADRDALLEQLRERPRRIVPAAAQGSPAPVEGTGLGLSRDDAEFLARYAADAARLQSDYNACVRTYSAVEAEFQNLQESELPAIY